MNIEEIRDQLQSIDLRSVGSLIQEEQYRSYFLEEPGLEHYKLLAYLSTQRSGQIILDVGTYKGCSAVALAHNPTNKVVSFDVAEGLVKLNSLPENIQFIIGDVTDSKHKHHITESSLILLDTNHDGPFEYKFYKCLVDMEWKGVLVLDDIKLNQPMKDFWKQIKEEKYDVSVIGHHSGTGIVVFK